MTYFGTSRLPSLSIALCFTCCQRVCVLCFFISWNLFVVSFLFVPLEYTQRWLMGSLNETRGYSHRFRMFAAFSRCVSLCAGFIAIIFRIPFEAFSRTMGIFHTEIAICDWTEGNQLSFENAHFYRSIVRSSEHAFDERSSINYLFLFGDSCRVTLCVCPSSHDSFSTIFTGATVFFCCAIAGKSRYAQYIQTTLVELIERAFTTLQFTRIQHFWSTRLVITKLALRATNENRFSVSIVCAVRRVTSSILTHFNSEYKRTEHLCKTLFDFQCVGESKLNFNCSFGSDPGFSTLSLLTITRKRKYTCYE